MKRHTSLQCTAMQRHTQPAIPKHTQLAMQRSNVDTHTTGNAMAQSNCSNAETHTNIAMQTHLAMQRHTQLVMQRHTQIAMRGTHTETHIPINVCSSASIGMCVIFVCASSLKVVCASTLRCVCLYIASYALVHCVSLYVHLLVVCTLHIQLFVPLTTATSHCHYVPCLDIGLGMR